MISLGPHAQTVRPGATGVVRSRRFVGHTKGHFSFLLFSTNTDFIRKAVSAGVDGIIVDWENAGKRARQARADTQINFDTVDDLRRVRAGVDALVICRINSHGTATPAEVEQAIDAGADELLLPMVRTVAEVEKTLEQASSRCGVGILIETEEAVAIAEELGRLPLTRVYLGLNDLGIARGTPNIFTAAADGTVERVREACGGVPFGFAGLTLPDRGRPIPCRLLINEMARLRCDFSFLRRSFLADVQERELAIAVPRIRAALAAAARAAPEAIAQDRRDLVAAIAAWQNS